MVHNVTLYPISFIFVLILFSDLCLCVQGGLFSSGFPNKTLYAFLISTIRAPHITEQDIQLSLYSFIKPSITYSRLLLNYFGLRK